MDTNYRGKYKTESDYSTFKLTVLVQLIIPCVFLFNCKAKKVFSYAIIKHFHKIIYFDASQGFVTLK